MSGCATQMQVSLPLHEGGLSVSRLIPQESVSAYVSGYESGWRATLRVFAEDIDHARTFQEDVASGDPYFLTGWFSGRDDGEVLVARLIGRIGKVAAKDRLEKATAK